MSTLWNRIKWWFGIGWTKSSVYWVDTIDGAFVVERDYTNKKTGEQRTHRKVVSW